VGVKTHNDSHGVWGGSVPLEPSLYLLSPRQLAELRRQLKSQPKKET
jgi:hypothetical protein